MKLWLVHNDQEYDHFVGMIVLAETAERAIELVESEVRSADYGRTKGPLTAEVLADDSSVEWAGYIHSAP